MIVHDVRFTPASHQDKVAGLIGYVSLCVGGLRIDGITVRRTREGEYRLSFPGKRDNAGIQRPYVCPLNSAVREEIEYAVLRHLHERGFIVWAGNRRTAQ